mgnify:CR=1 FL=1
MNDSELLECADAVTKLTTAQFSEEKAKLVVDTASNKGFQIDTLTKLAQIKYVYFELHHHPLCPITIYAKNLLGLIFDKKTFHRLSLIDKAHV